MAQPARERLLEAAARLIRERGMTRVTTKEIAEAAGAAEGSLFKNFGDKMGLLTTLLSQELPENRAWREAATEAGPGDLETVLSRLMERAIDFYSASLPLVAGAIADTDLLRRQQHANREAGTGPQLAIDAMDTRFRTWQKAGQLAPDTDTYSLALLFCGSAQMQAYVEHLAGPDSLRGTRGERTAALVRALTRAAARQHDDPAMTTHRGRS
jgi:AcrR family transcriptional regulator